MEETQWLQAVVLGIVQGLTEFLPISSSAHLLLLPWVLDWENLGLTFDVLLHSGTLLAVLVFFRRECGHATALMVAGLHRYGWCPGPAFQGSCEQVRAKQI